jgi:hypothetical protein
MPVSWFSAPSSTSNILKKGIGNMFKWFANMSAATQLIIELLDAILITLQQNSPTPKDMNRRERLKKFYPRNGDGQ